MRNLKIYSKTCASILVLAICMLSACKSDEQFDFEGDGTNRVYFNTENYTVNNYNAYLFPVIHTPAGSLGNVNAAFAIKSTLEAPADIKVKYVVDYSLIDSYNAANGTQYVKLPDGLLTMGATELTIPQGRLATSDSVKVAVPADKLSQLTAPGYIVPFKITSTSDGAQISANQNTAYLVIKTTVTNAYNSPVLADMTGALIASRTGWTATLDPAITSGALANLFDARTNTNIILNPAKVSKLTVDMASARTKISGVRFHTNSTTYAITSAAISTSTDGVTWTPQGTATVSIASAYQYVKFYTPVTARYIRLEFLAWRSTQLVFTEFDVYQNS
jgi:hypothetical protein